MSTRRERDKHSCWFRVAVASLLTTAFTTHAMAQSTNRDLSDYYLYACGVEFDACPSGAVRRLPPIVAAPALPIPAGRVWERYFYIETSRLNPNQTLVYRPYAFVQPVPCRIESTTLDRPVFEGAIIRESNRWRWGYAEGCGPDFFIGPSPVRWTLDDEISIGAPVRRRALDGSEFDASPMSIVRAGAPWATYYWGYKIGLVETQSDWNDANRSKFPADWPGFPPSSENFKLTALPAPWAEGEVTEYANSTDFPKQPDAQYFYAASDADRALLDALPNWWRTGRGFKHGGYVSVCRFYGGNNGGPNTHFYSASDTECNWLKGFNFLSYEGQTFRVNLPLPLAANAPAGTRPACPVGSIPLYRLYNNAGALGKTYVSNHRYVTSRSEVEAAVSRGWLDEGTVMCVPE
ncbi:MAG: hypothetical protein JNL19_12730 [Burkholderiales bacterium]|nr:hypothetical protein [Burkholderiales bacterium]